VGHPLIRGCPFVRSLGIHRHCPCLLRAMPSRGHIYRPGRDPRLQACDRGQFAATAGRRTGKNAAVAAYTKWLLEAGLRHDVELANANAINYVASITNA
jgi:hypothetical protein